MSLITIIISIIFMLVIIVILGFGVRSSDKEARLWLQVHPELGVAGLTVKFF